MVLALGEKSRDHVPYRSSRLTYLLKASTRLYIDNALDVKSFVSLNPTLLS